ncbi:MAG: hypothetical protein HXX13_01115 [Bacteroidetes bacterium]|nr:hypothetical protein [Bacteroidota bacterium]
MKKGIRIFTDYLLFGNIYIAACAVSIALSTFLFLHKEPDILLLCFIFFLTIISYDLHAYFNPLLVQSSVRMSWIRVNKSTLLISMIVAFAAACYCFFLLHHLFSWFLLLTLLTLIYSLPRIFPPLNDYLIFIQKIKVFYLSMIWLMVTVFTPIISSGSKIDFFAILGISSTYFLILLVCLIFDERDKNQLSYEQRASILKKLNNQKTSMFFHSVLMLAVGSTIIKEILYPDLYIFTANLIAQIAVLLVFITRKTDRTDYWYYLLVDGILLIPGLMLFLLKMSSTS